jgi:hypothetical protein
MTKDEDLSFALFRVIDRSDPEDQPKDQVADREEHRPMIQSPRSRIGTLLFDPFTLLVWIMYVRGAGRLQDPHALTRALSGWSRVRRAVWAVSSGRRLTGSFRSGLNTFLPGWLSDTTVEGAGCGSR